MGDARLLEAKLLGVKAAAHALGVSATTVRTMADNGKIASEKNAVGARQFRIDDLNQALAVGRDRHSR